ncbi:tRNA pseudouridine synthase A, putative [Entamoeba dispar SAW760]|uniref:tRNA pseudouridine synthase A, putative n=1 Tax=Entamoeba dispar (strain ATCC PRA-260 / SAW760) TaxID=370354 RepID=B0EEF0_ENTDS|nr:tRNA pseudouridine synthase A, putative [Entamoeba dispar SAW760]EDR27064.1 tRNA pseudouridine synthase A, putative [Entamoeba dispar SAW760]|eukprot:EDR27064.1 tRNA pseudouridine synthase A, putative [Entamoeba dispar SAW760]
MKRSEAPTDSSPFHLPENQPNKEIKIEDPKEKEEEKKERIKKFKVAVIFSYVGRGYFGLMYLNNNPKTIEGEIENAMYKAKCISEDNKHDLKKVGWSRCARTDKGVSAANNLISLKMGLDGNYIERINSFLPETIRIQDVVKVSHSFNAKTRVDSRTYEYIFPSYAIQKIDSEHPEINVEYNPQQEDVDYFNSVISNYVKTHNFQNYTFNTKETKADSKSNNRYIISMSAQLVQRNGLNVIAVSIHGQSFMLWQIRRMIGFAIVLTNFRLPIEQMNEIMKTSFTLINWRSVIPTAPAHGLFLDQCHFGNHNERLQRDTSNTSKTNINSEETLKKCIEFKEKYIWTDIINFEKEEQPFAKYMKEQVNYNKIYDVLTGKVTLEYYNSIHKPSMQTVLSEEEQDEN